MRVHAQQKILNRKKILCSASRLYREYGIEGIGIQKLSKTVGLTHGSFYKQFPDGKRQLMSEAVALMFDEYFSVMDEPATIEAVVDRYLSSGHLKAVHGGCPVPLLSPDVYRNKQNFKDVYDNAIKRILQSLMKKRGLTDEVIDKDRAMQIFASLAGTLLIAKAIDDENFSRQFLEANKKLWNAAS